MLASQFHGQLLADLAPVTVNGAVGYGTFVRVVTDALKRLAAQLKAAGKAAIDTEEERDAIVESVMKLADSFVAGKFSPLVWAYFRQTLADYLDEQIDRLPALVEG